MLDQLSGGRSKARVRILKALLEEEEIDVSRAATELGTTAAVLKFLEENRLAHVENNVLWRDPVSRQELLSLQESTAWILDRDQEEALDRIRSAFEPEAPGRRPVLLKGVTGSGKTLLYMELINDYLKKGRQVIMLIPEIALTYQTVNRFYARFGSRVSVINSRLSAGERYDQFRRARNGEVSIMIGPRSALFTPFEKLGLIIIDEEHEPSYKSENSPRYHARETAQARAQLEGAALLLGSATPSLEAYQMAREGSYVLVELKSRYAHRPMAKVQVVDMRQELRSGNRLPVSRLLREELESCLEAGEQAMLFLNRRGYAGFVSCRNCGEVIKCPHCDVAMTEHMGGRLICHYCGYERSVLITCPVCASNWIGGFRAGTQQIEKVLKKILPAARVLRMDFDTTRKKGSYEEILRAFSAHEADILVGTQMIVKGHDFPDVTLVGALAADLSLFGSDFRCAERTFQLLTQAAGRAGRGEKAGKAVFQTYHPEHYCIETAVRQDYEAFFEEEMGFRVLMGYPPASAMLAVHGAGADDGQLQTAMSYLARFVRRLHPGEDLSVIGPAPESVGKIRDVYHRALYLKHASYRILRELREKIEQYISINSGFRDIYFQFDSTVQSGTNEMPG